METIYLILAAAVFVYLGVRYCKKSIEIENITPCESIQVSDTILAVPVSTEPKLKVDMSADAPIVEERDIKVPTQKDILHIFALRFEKSVPYDKNLKLSIKAMYNMYLQFNEDLLFGMAPYQYANFCKEIRKEFNFVTIKDGKTQTTELHGYQYMKEK